MMGDRTQFQFQMQFNPSVLSDNIVTYAYTYAYTPSDKFMHAIVLHSIVLLRSLLYCMVNLLLGGYNTIQCHA